MFNLRLRSFLFFPLYSHQKSAVIKCQKSLPHVFICYLRAFCHSFNPLCYCIKGYFTLETHVLPFFIIIYDICESVWSQHTTWCCFLIWHMLCFNILEVVNIICCCFQISEFCVMPKQKHRFVWQSSYLSNVSRIFICISSCGLYSILCVYWWKLMDPLLYFAIKIPQM